MVKKYEEIYLHFFLWGVITLRTSTVRISFQMMKQMFFFEKRSSTISHALIIRAGPSLNKQCMMPNGI